MSKDILEVISTRQSIRRYRGDPVDDELVLKILEAGRWAPSGENEQPWELIVVRNPETRAKIGELSKIGTGQRMHTEYCLGEMEKRFAGIEDPAKKASLMRFLCTGDVSLSPTTAPVLIVVMGKLKGMFDVPYDLSACIENMLLEAHSLGLGAVWVHGPAVYPRVVRKLKEILRIPTGMGEYKLIAYVAIGWPEGQRRHPRPKLPLEKIVHWEEYGGRARN
jgi:nitroreductase